MRKSFKTPYNFGDRVYLKTDLSTPRVVNGFLVRADGISIGLACGTDETWHTITELEVRKDFIVKGFYGKYNNSIS